MGTKKTESETPEEASGMSNHKGYGLGWGSIFRIAIAVVLIVWAYAAWVVMGNRDNMSAKWDHGKMARYDDERSMRWEGMKHDSMMPMSTMSHDPMAMSMKDMGKMLEGKTWDALSRAFLAGMIPHHQAAVDMAKSLAGSDKPELVKLGWEIISAQTKEIEQMKAWQIAWGYVSTGATMNGTMNSEEAMMRDHCLTMPGMAGCEKYR